MQQDKCELRCTRILQSIGIMVIQGKETRVVIQVCRYSSGHLIPNSSLHNLFIEIKIPTRISADVGDHPCFLTVIPIDYKITRCVYSFQAHYTVL